MRMRFLAGVSALALVGASGAHAQSADAVSEIEEVVVTGSYLPGAQEGAAVPVDVISREDLEAQGSPSTTQFLKTLTTSGAFIGESSRSLGATAPGNASVNLRSLGSARTLTLFNGRRMADAANRGGGTGANLRFIPSVVVGRVEVLRDSASATYGSDAVGGVVNFITRRDLAGFEAAAEVSKISGSKGDATASLAWGRQTEGGNILAAASYRHYSQLEVTDRDWAVAPYESPEIATWSGASDVSLYRRSNTPFSTIFRDNGCVEMGGVLTEGSTVPVPGGGGGATAPWGKPINPGVTPTTGNICRFNTGQLGELVSQEDDYQLHFEINQALSDKLDFHAEATWFRADVPDQKTSPSNAEAQYPTPTSLGGRSGSVVPPLALNNFVPYHVPGRNPGFRQLAADCGPTGAAFGEFSAAQCTYIRAAANPNGLGAGIDGVDIHLNTWRPLAFAGYPLTDDGANRQTTVNTAWRASGGLRGEFGPDIRFDTALTYMESKSENTTSDLLPNRLQDALNGFGSRLGDSNDCSAAEKAVAANAGNAAAGCYYFNPFTSSIATSVINGQANPYYRANVANDPRVVAAMYGEYTNVWTNQIAVADAVFNGDLPLELAGGQVVWALGGQARYERHQQAAGGFFDRDQYPCVDSIDDGQPSCNSPAGALLFLGSGRDYDLDRTVGAVFGEISLPITDSFEANLAVRYERYPGGVGSTTDPRVQLRWTATDWLTLRASASTAFRAPPMDWLQNDFEILATSINGQFRSQRRFGHSDLKPERSKSANLGALFNAGGLRASVDYWRYDFKDVLTVESATDLFDATFGLSGAGCASPSALLGRFTFGGACAPDAIVSVVTNYVNGDRIKTSGFDLRADYDVSDRFGEILGGDLRVGGEATYLERFETAAQTLREAPGVTIRPERSLAGLGDYARVRGNLYAAYDRGALGLRWQTRYVSGTDPAPGEATFRWVLQGGAYVQEPIHNDAYWQHDLTARWTLHEATTFTLSIQNLFDADPPERDITRGSALGRVFEVGVRARF